MLIRSILMLLALTLFAVPVSGQVSYDRKRQLLSVSYEGVPLRDVLSEVSRKTGITVYIDPAVQKNVFISRRNAPLDEVLNEIIKPLNNMFIYKGSEIQAVRIYQQSPSEAMQKIEPGKPAPAAVPAVETAPVKVNPSAEPAEKRSGRGVRNKKQRLHEQEEE